MPSSRLTPACVTKLLFLIAAVSQAAQEPAAKPVLRIEAGAHTATITSIGADSAGRIVATASNDKSVRVWELPSGRLLRVLRPPLSEGDEGKLYAVAVSPEGRFIACGGWTTGRTGWRIYIFDRESGDVTNRIDGLPSGVLALAWSPDGTMLAANLAGPYGVRVYRAPKYLLAGADREYGGAGNGLDFWAAPGGGRTLLASTSYDGFVRLYEAGAGRLRLLAKRPAPGGKQPYRMRFSPDGSQLAVGFSDVPAVSVLRASDLSPDFTPHVAGLTASLDRVEWSADGRFLYAGGRHRAANATFIVRWADGGRGARTDIAAAKNSIMDLAALGDGSIAFGAAGGDFGVLSPNGKTALHRPAPIADYRALLDRLRISPDGSRVCFGYETFGGAPACFSVLDRALAAAAYDGVAVHRPMVVGLPVTEWTDTTSPKFAGAPLPLQRREMSRCLAIAPDRGSFLLGADWSLRRFDRNGKEIWNVAVPGVVWSVNVSPDGRLGVGAFGDGSIRWYRMDDGKQLLAFFPHRDGQRWVIWTPSGYYDASPGGEDLIGWHVNSGPDDPVYFFPASRFRSTYYRPDVIARALSTRDEAEAVRLADAAAGRNRTEQQSLAQRLPPLVRILSPADSAEVSTAQVALRFSVRTPSGEPVTSIRALVDGRLAGRVDAPGQAAGGAYEARISIPERDCEVSLVAENRFAAGEPATVRLRWRGRQAFVIKPKLYALAIGVSAYPEPHTLRFAAKDAGDFVAALMRQKGLLYRDIETRTLIDRQATKENILDGLEWIEKSVTQHDVAMVFLSGHGVNDNSGTYYYLPVNFDAERLKRTGLPMSDIRTTVQALAGKALFFVDSCHSGNVLGGRARALAADINALVNELASAENGAVVFASSSGRQVSLESEEWGNGAFTKALVEALTGKADLRGDGRITINMLDLYISERVKQLTGGRQTPTTAKPQTIADFPVAVR